MPSIEAAASAAEIAAAIGVIVSVIYLAIQVREANRVSKQQAYKDILDLMHSPIDQMMANSELADTIRRGGPDPEQLSETEWFQYSFWWMMQLNMYEFLYVAHRQGKVVPNVWQGTDASWSTVIREWPGVRRAWQEWRHAYGEDFQSYVDEMVNACEQ